ncbi:MAG: hypothetical protein ACPGVK_04915 [Halocynthiibacter sp.]
MFWALITSSIWVISFALLSFFPIPLQKRVGWIWLIALIPICVLLVRAFGIWIVIAIGFAVVSMLRRPLGALWRFIRVKLVS